MKNSPPLFFTIFALLLTSCGYRADRFDEQILTRQENHFNLYRNVRLKILDELNRNGNNALLRGEPGGAAEKLFSEEAITYDGDGSYAAVSFRFNKTPPLVQGYRNECGTKERRLLFSVPLVRNNALLLRYEKNGIRTFQVLLSLRYDTLVPIIFKNNYELFILTLKHDEIKSQWEIAEFKNVTDSKTDAVQGVFSMDGGLISYVEDDRKNHTRLFIMNRDGTDRRIVAENGMLPCFLEDGNLIFVSNAEKFGNFRIYTPHDGECRDASDAEIAHVLRTMPYGGLREFYLRFGKNPSENLSCQVQTLRQLFEFGYRNSPLILQSFYEYLAVKARNTQNLFDIGPDFFMGADYLLTSNIFFETPADPYYVIGDRIGNDNFIRFLTGFSIPVIPNMPLRWAQRYYDDWREQYGRAAVLKAANEYTGRLSRLVFDYWQNMDELVLVELRLDRNKKQLERFQKQLEYGYGTSERVIFAENIRSGLLSEQNSMIERMIWCQAELAALIGVNPEKRIQLPSDPENLEKLKTLHSRRSSVWFQAQAKINRQELRQIDALIQQDAAVRDMGPERTRIDAVRVRISYGVGFIDWRRLVDDFLLLGVSYAIPLRLPKFFESYYQDYGNRIQALRMRKYQLEGSLEAEVGSAWMDYASESGRAEHREKRAQCIREQARLTGLLQNYGTRDMTPPTLDFDEYSAELENLTERNTGMVSQYERLRRLSLLYQASGRSDVFMKETLAAIEEHPVTGRCKGDPEIVRGIYLWSAPELIRSKKHRDRFFEICQKNGINLVYCYFSMKDDKIPFLQKYEPEYAFFLEKCKRLRIRVWALLGEQEWLIPGQRRDMYLLLDSYQTFNRNRVMRGEAFFDGISLDVEPHSAPGWNDGRRQERIVDYLGLLDEVSKKIGKDKLNVAVPDSYAGVPVFGKTADLLKEVSLRSGSLTLMVYRDSGEKVLEKARPILARDDLKTEALVAVETHEVQESGISFFGLPRSVFLDILKGISANCFEYKNFSGVVIHDYIGFSGMR